MSYEYNIYTSLKKCEGTYYLVKNEWETRWVQTQGRRFNTPSVPKPHSWHQMCCVLGRCVVLFLVCRFFFLCVRVYSCQSCFLPVVQWYGIGELILEELSVQCVMTWLSTSLRVNEGRDEMALVESCGLVVAEMSAGGWMRLLSVVWLNMWPSPNAERRRVPPFREGALNGISCGVQQLSRHREQAVLQAGRGDVLNVIYQKHAVITVLNRPSLRSRATNYLEEKTFGRCPASQWILKSVTFITKKCNFEPQVRCATISRQK